MILVWVLVFVTWRGKFWEQPVLECRIFRNYSLHAENKNGVWCAMSTLREKSTVCRQELQRVNNVLRWILAAFVREGNIFSIFCSISGFLLDFLIGYYRSEFFLTPFTDWWTSRDSVYIVTLAERQAGAYCSSRKTKKYNLYIESTWLKVQVIWGMLWHVPAQWVQHVLDSAGTCRAHHCATWGNPLWTCHHTLLWWQNEVL